MIVQSFIAMSLSGLATPNDPEPINCYKLRDHGHLFSFANGAPRPQDAAWLTTPDGLKVPSGVMTIGLPLSPLPEVDLWLAFVREAGLNLQDPDVVDRVTSLCAACKDRILTKRRQAIQPRYDELNSAIAVDPEARRSQATLPMRMELLALAIRDCRTGAGMQVSEWTSALEAAAMSSGQSDRLSPERTAIVAAKFHRTLLGEKLGWGPVPVPHLFSVDVESVYENSDLKGTSGEFLSALEAYRRDAMPALVESFEAYERHYRSRGAGSSNKTAVERAVRRIVDVRIVAIRDLSASASEGGERWKAEQLCAMHPNADPIYRVACELAFITKTGLSESEARVLDELLRAAEAGSKKATQLFVDYLQAHWQEAEDRKPKTRLVYRDGLGEAASQLQTAIAAAVDALPPSPDPDSLRARMTRATVLLGMPSAEGRWTAMERNPSWPGGVVQGSAVPFGVGGKETAKDVEPEPTKVWS
jgi:hypothetical protein